MAINLDVYSDIHRSILQTLMSHGTIEQEKLEQIFKLVWEKFLPEHEFENETLKHNLQKTIEKINEKIGRFDQKIIQHEYGLNQHEYYIFISTAKTSLAKLQNCFNEYELDYFKHIFLKIAQNENLNIKPREALNLQTNVKVSKQRVEKLIETWIAAGYFYRNNDLIYLGPKSISECIEPIHNLNLVHLKKCGLCEEISAWGTTCNSCNTATFHKKCIQKFLARSEKCPSCMKKWK